MLPPAATRLGLGVTGPHATPAVTREGTARLVHAALDLGVTLFDTGPMYGAGEGERRLGGALASVARERVFVCTKARTWNAGDERAPAAIVAASLAESLQRLGLDHVDALFLHGPRPADIAAPVLETLASLKAAGRIRFAGVCGRGPECLAGLASGGIDLLMAPVAGADALLAAAARRGVPVFAIETMRGRRSPWRAPASVADAWYLARAARDAWIGAAPPPGDGVAAALSRPAVASVIVQTTRAAHLAENARAAGLQIAPGTR